MAAYDVAIERAARLKRWTAFSQAWKDDVGCVAVETDDGLVFIDPLSAPAQLGSPAHTLITVFFHAREAQGRVWAPRATVRRLANRGVAVTDPFEPGERLPGGITSFATARSGEVVYWLAEQRVIVVGDVLLGAGAKPRPTTEPLRLCPERWLGRGASLDSLRESLRPLLDLPVEQVLVSHGEPVTRGGHAAVRYERAPRVMRRVSADVVNLYGPQVPLVRILKVARCIAPNFSDVTPNVAQQPSLSIALH